MAWRIELSKASEKQLAKLGKVESKRITGFLRERLAVLDDPRSIGKALTGPRLGEYRRYRIGNNRVICSIRDRQVTVLVIEIGNRQDVYQ